MLDTRHRPTSKTHSTLDNELYNHAYPTLATQPPPAPRKKKTFPRCLLGDGGKYYVHAIPRSVARSSKSLNLTNTWYV
jgi:hypothetical protein